MEEKKEHRRKKLKYGSMATLITLIVTVVVILINVVVGLLVKRYPDIKLDLTASNLYAVSEETTDYIKKLDRDVEIAVSAEEENLQSDSYLKMVSEVLKKYEGYSDHITLSYFDITKDPDVLSKYQSLYNGTISANQVIIRCGDRVRVCGITDLFEMDQNKLQYYYYGMASLSDCITAFKGEQVLTNEIMNASDANIQRVAMVSTSGGSEIFARSNSNYYAVQGLMTLLGSNGYDVTEVDMLNDAISPEDYDVVILPAPLNDLTVDAIGKLEDFLYNNGSMGKRMVYFSDFTQGNTPNLNAFLKDWNVEIGDSYVIDDNASTRQAVNLVMGNGQSYYVPVVSQANMDYSGSLSNMSLPILAPFSRPISARAANNGRVVIDLLQTADTAYCYPLDLNHNEELAAKAEAAANGEEISTEEEEAAVTTAFDTTTAERRGQTIMAIAQNQVNQSGTLTESDILVVGSMSFLDYAMVQDSSYNNAEYFVSVMNALCGKEENIVIAAKNLSVSSLDITESQVRVVIITVVFIIPVLMIALGFFIFLRRRSR